MKERYRCGDYRTPDIILVLMVFVLMWTHFEIEWLRTLLIIWLIFEIIGNIWVLTMPKRHEEGDLE